MRILSTLLALTVCFCLTHIAEANDGCPNAVYLSIAKDNKHTTWMNHGTDVKKYAEEHPFGTRDFAPLHIQAGDGGWCVSFGTLRDFRYAMPGITFVVVTVGNQQVFHDTDVNEFHVLGVKKGDKIKIEFVQLAPFSTDNCRRQEIPSISDIPRVGEPRPRTTFVCKGPSTTSWNVLEERVYIVDSDLGQ